jgi:hypothetical protein
MKSGERVIATGLQQVRPGATVEPKLIDMPASAAATGPAAPTASQTSDKP